MAVRNVDLLNPVIKNASPAESELIRRVLVTGPFSRSALLTRFLMYICERKLEGREDEISEYQIGVQALGRPGSYSPGEDNIVRNYARILRRRLDEYFAGEGRNESVRITIPVGQYIPVFEPNHATAGLIPADTNNHQKISASPDNGKQSAVAGAFAAARFHWMWGTALLALAACVITVVHFKQNRLDVPMNAIFWKQIFDHNYRMFLVPGDSGFAMMQDIAGKEVHLNDYISGDLKEEFSDLNAAAFRQDANFGPERFSNYVSTADMSVVLGVVGLAQRYAGSVQVRYARDMHLEDFKGANVILIGGPHANPWDEVFDPESNFHMNFPMHLDGMHIDERMFINKHPRPGEQRTYSNRASESSRVAYSLISFLPGTDGTGNVLMLQGQNMPGTQAAGDFLFDQTAMEPILRKARTSDGRIGPFEVLLEASTVGANAVQSRVVVERYSTLKSSE
jgi:hypothetical protein